MRFDGAHRPGREPAATAPDRRLLDPRGAAAYRPDLDGLRALAVLAVMAFHAAPGRVTGGFVGVDVFFVISGYVITLSLLRDRGDENRLAGFYRRRIRRLFPALLAVLVATSVVAWSTLPLADLKHYFRHLVWGALFLSNYGFWRESGYFNSFPAAKPLLHLWSLGVEEQFYLLWPPILLLVGGNKRSKAIIALLALLSLMLSVHLSMTAAATAFFSPFSRGWEFLAGALAALAPPARLGRHPAASWTGTAGLLMIAASVVVVNLDRPYPGWWALLPTCGAVLLVVAGPDGWAGRKLLSHPVLVGIGLISYPLYLWHWPLISFASTLTYDVLPWTWRLGALLLSFPLAWMTFRFVERPARRGGGRTVACLVAAMAALCGAGLTANRLTGRPGLRPVIDPRIAFVSSYRNALLAPRAFNCSLGNTERGTVRTALPAPCLPQGKPRTWLILGDSHANALTPGLRHAAPADVAVAELYGGGCAPLDIGKSRFCSETARASLSLVAMLRPELVLLAQQHDHDRRDWNALALQLKRAGARSVVLIGPVPQWLGSLPQIVATHDWPRIPAYERTSLDAAILSTDAKLRNADSGRFAFTYLPLIPRLCSSAGCRASVPGTQPPVLMVRDYGHLTPEGAAYIAESIIVPELEAHRPGAAGGERAGMSVARRSR
ncbi:MAG: O-acetyltransferase OatA [Alphaproteobacteria bacterium]|nr:O-acetyltransferase OatA [Alphaproteobacteria bacterium]